MYQSKYDIMRFVVIYVYSTIADKSYPSPSNFLKRHIKANRLHRYHLNLAIRLYTRIRIATLPVVL